MRPYSLSARFRLGGNGQHSSHALKYIHLTFNACLHIGYLDMAVRVTAPQVTRYVGWVLRPKCAQRRNNPAVITSLEGVKKAATGSVHNPRSSTYTINLSNVAHKSFRSLECQWIIKIPSHNRIEGFPNRKLDTVVAILREVGV